MTRPIGYYIHHQGAGHLRRARLLKAAIDRPCTLFGTFEAEGDVFNLPDDRETEDAFSGCDDEADRPYAFHYSPLNVAGLRDRMARIAAWVAQHDPVLFIVDVSVEVALFVRLMGVPMVTVRLAGRRDDAPHLEAFRAAEALLAPFPIEFENHSTPEWVRKKTIYAGLIGPSVSERTAYSATGVIAVVIGRGGSGYNCHDLAEAAEATPLTQWHVYGPTTGETTHANLHIHGWVDNLDLALDHAEIIVGGAGDGLIADVAARRKAFVCLPEHRAFDEQRDKAATLARLGCAVTLPAWPNRLTWPSVLRKARALDLRDLNRLLDPDALKRTVEAIEKIAARYETNSRR